MFGSDDEDDDSPSLGDLTQGTEARQYRDPDGECDFCGSSEGSVVVDRETEKARCKDCLNDPSTYEDQS